MPIKKRERYIKSLGLNKLTASVLTSHKKISDLFEEVSKQSGEPVEAANLITGEIMKLMKSTNTLPEDLSLDAGKLAVLISLVKKGSISRNAFKETVEAVFTQNIEPMEYIKQKGLIMVSDGKAVTDAVNAVIENNRDAVNDYISGKEKAFGFLMGQVMKRLGGGGNPELARKALTEKLKSES